MVAWKNIQRWEGMSGEDLAAFPAERSRHGIETEFPSGYPCKRVCLLLGWECEQWEYASQKEARMDWALMIVS